MEIVSASTEKAFHEAEAILKRLAGQRRDIVAESSKTSADLNSIAAAQRRTVGWWSTQQLAAQQRGAHVVEKELRERLRAIDSEAMKLMREYLSGWRMPMIEQEAERKKLKERWEVLKHGG